MFQVTGFFLILLMGIFVPVEGMEKKAMQRKNIAQVLREEALEEAIQMINEGLKDYPGDEDLKEDKNDWYIDVEKKINNDRAKAQIDIGTLYEDLRLSVFGLTSQPTEHWQQMFGKFLQEILQRAVTRAKQTEKDKKEFVETLTGYAKTIKQEDIKAIILKAVQDLQGTSSVSSAAPSRSSEIPSGKLPIESREINVAGVSTNFEDLTTRLHQLQTQYVMLKAQMPA